MTTEALSVESRARIHAALADPARLSIVDMLTLADASPGEIARALGLSTNLVAHHLNVLQDTGLVARTPSEGDRRRTYLRLVPQTLARLGPTDPKQAGRVMGEIMKANKGKFEAATVKRFVEEELGAKG